MECKREREGERETERERDTGAGELSSDREGGRVLRGGVELERIKEQSCAEEDFACYQQSNEY